MTTKISILGCGDMGSRHLQAISKLTKKTEIHIIEPNSQSIKRAKKRLNEISYNKEHSFHWHKSINELDNGFDLAIIATTSQGRVKLINELIEKDVSRFLVEKVVCQSIDEYDFLVKILKKNKGKGWINLFRRYFKSYQKIKKIFSSEQPINLNIIAGNEGLGSNIIHLADLFSWLNENNKVNLNGNDLLPTIFHSKRGTNFKEFLGIITGTAGRATMKLNYLPIANLPRIIELKNSNSHLIIDEINEKIISFNGKQRLQFKIELASNITKKIVEDILLTDNCMLPTLEYSYHTHKEIFRIFNLHLKKYYGKKLKLCPIT